MTKRGQTDHPFSIPFSESMFKQIVEEAHEGILICNAELQIIYTNQKLHELTNSCEAQLSGQSVLEFFGKLTRFDAKSALCRSLAGESLSSNPIQIIPEHCHVTTWVIGTFSPFFNTGKDIRGVIVKIQDITEHKHQQEEKNLKKQHLDNNQKILLELTKTTGTDIENAYRFITEKVSEVIGTERTSIWLYNEQRTAIYCGDLFIRSLGLHNRGMMLFVDEYPAYFAALEQSRCIAASEASKDARTIELENIYLSKLDIRSMLDTPIRFDGKLAGMICSESVGEMKEWTLEDQEFSSSVADILSTLIRTHQLRQTERALEQSEEKYRQIVDNALIGIYRSNLSGQMLFVNQAMADIMEIADVSVAIASNFDNFYPNIQERKTFLTRLVREHILRNFELSLITAKGKQRVVLVNAYYEAGTILGMVMDITDRKSAEEEIRNAHERASESDRMKTSLMANMSHEFRTPMNAILGFSDLIATDSNDSEIVFFARKIHTAGKRLMTTLKAILDLADLEATRSKLKTHEINIHDSISTALLPFHAAANEKSLYLITEFKENLIAISDENLLQIILHNLIDNAIKFTSNGGVTIETDHAVMEGQAWAFVRIKDTGIGIPREHFDLIFHEFRQISEGYNRSYEGTGLGLTIARKMTEMLHGKIVVESEVGLGSIFTVWLPAGANNLPTGQRATALKNNSSASRTFRIKEPEGLPLLLVVEDNDDNAEIINLYLRGKYITERATNAFSAIKMAMARQYAAILMDINLGPGMDGLKAAQEIRKSEMYRDTPILAITGYTMAGDCEKLLAGGCSHYLGKPFSQQGLLDNINIIFAGNSQVISTNQINERE